MPTRSAVVAWRADDRPPVWRQRADAIATCAGLRLGDVGIHGGEIAGALDDGGGALGPSRGLLFVPRRLRPRENVCRSRRLAVDAGRADQDAMR